MSVKKRNSSITLIARGNEPLMKEVRRILNDLQAAGQPLGIVSSFTGDVSYDPETVAVFIYDEHTMRTSGRTTPIRKKSSCLCVGHQSSLYERLEMDIPTWAPRAKVFIALWSDPNKERLPQAVESALRRARKILEVLAIPSGPSKRKQKAAAYRALNSSRRHLPVMNRPSPDYILALEERDGIIGS